GNVAPILAAGQRCRLRGGGFVQHRARKHLWNIVGMNGDQADGALGLERAQSFNDRAHWQTRSAAARDLDGDKVAVGGARRAAFGDRQLAAELLFLDRDQTSAAVWQRAENPEHAMLRPVDELDD